MQVRLLFLALALPTSVLANHVVTVASGDALINRAECQDAQPVGVRWSNLSPPANTTVRVYLTGASDTGSDTPVCNFTNVKLLEGNTDDVEGGTRNFTATDIVDRKKTGCGLDGSSDPGAGVEGSIRVCVEYLQAAAVVHPGDLSLTFDTIIPDGPGAVTVVGGQQNLKVSWTQPVATDIARYRIHFRRADSTGAFSIREVEDRDALSGKVDGLKNDVRYEVFVTALDDVNNESAESPHAFGAPRDVNDFYDVYREAGGRDEGGCATGAGQGGWAALAGLLALQWARRRR